MTQLALHHAGPHALLAIAASLAPISGILDRIMLEPPRKPRLGAPRPGYGAGQPHPTRAGRCPTPSSASCSPMTVTPLRNRLLWRMLYETAARASEVLLRPACPDREGTVIFYR